MKNITIIMSPLPTYSKVGKVLLDKFLNILPKEECIYLISGNVPKEFLYKDKLEIIGNIDYDTRRNEIIFKILRYIIMQTKFSFIILKNRNRIDIVYFWISSALLLPMITLKLLKKKTLIMATGTVSINYKSLKLLEAINYYLSDTIGVESENVIRYLRLQKCEKKIVLLHLYVDNKFTITKEIRDRDDIIGYIGRLSKEKGILEFLDAVEILMENNPDIKILIGGSGPLKSIVEERIKKFNGNILFLDWIPFEEMVKVLNSIKILILPSYSEGLPNIALEAMACGTPVLATPVGGIPDIIKDKDTGFILENNSSECIAKNVTEAMKYQNLDTIIRNARKLIEKEYLR